MAIAPPSSYNQWQGSTKSILTDREGVYYRVWGGKSARRGEWLTPVKPLSQSAARAGLALPPDNAATDYSEVRVPPKTRIQVGVAGPNFGHPGGWEQVRVLDRIPRHCFGPPLPVPPP